MTKLKVGDVVQVCSGQQKGEHGAILKFSKDKARVVIDGVNQRVRNRKATAGQAGEQVEFYAPVHISNVMVIDPKSGKPTRLGYKTDAGGKVRFAKASGTDIPGLATTAPKAVKKTKKKTNEDAK